MQVQQVKDGIAGIADGVSGDRRPKMVHDFQSSYNPQPRQLLYTWL